MTETKYAILDTDFVSKANIIQTDDGNVLADRVLEFPDYVFVCHEMMLEELSRHGTQPAQEWLTDKVSIGDIQKYTDEDILELLEEELGTRCYSMYLSLLKRSCDAFGTKYFEEKYEPLISLTDNTFTDAKRRSADKQIR